METREEHLPDEIRISVVVPMFNSMRTLPEVVSSILEAVAGFEGTEIIFVDNGSTDGSTTFVSGLENERVRLLRLPEVTVAALRNHGARNAAGTYLSFLDSDCIIPPEYYHRALSTLRSTGASATGCKVQLPAHPHWIEETWHNLHYQGRDRFVHYINSGNFFVRRDAFLGVGGFAEDLVTDEDWELGQRMLDAGEKLFECTAVEAIHLGNPKTLGAFYRRELWHAAGMFSTIDGWQWDRPTILMGTHALATILGTALILLGFFSSPPLPWVLCIALLLQLLAPGASMAYRSYQLRRPTHLLRGTVLYWLYYWARLHALGRKVLGRGIGHWKG
jgi:glycosyltransferase involved in cell wall biosynthesis